MVLTRTISSAVWYFATHIVGEDAYIISPGVGKQGGDAKKTLEISDAIIVGRSIYEADNPKIACENLLK